MELDTLKSELKTFIDTMEIPKLFGWLSKHKKTIIILSAIYAFYKWITSEDY